MNELVFSQSLYNYLEEQLLANHDFETCAVLLMSRVTTATKTRFLVREAIIAPPENYTVRTNRAAELSAEFVSNVVQRARSQQLSVCFVHSHVGLDSGIPQFSHQDNLGEKRLKCFLAQRTGTSDHVALVMSASGENARMLGADESVSVCRIGANVVKTYAGTNSVTTERYDRQVRAFGQAGQRLLSSQTVAIVGLGGTGSIVTQSLAYLGVKSYILIDYDTVSTTNLNRLVGASAEDVGRLKVEVVRDNILRTQNDAIVRVIPGDVTELRVSRQLRDADFVFGCTDSHGSRAVLNQFSYQYLTPVIDMGMSLASTEDCRIKTITGRVQMLSPGFGCLVCGNLLDYDQVRWDFMDEKERENDPYFLGPGEVAPSVISINGAIASLAVSMFLGAITGIPSHARMQIYDGIKGTVRAAKLSPIAGCVVCSNYGSLAKGDLVELPGRVVYP